MGIAEHDQEGRVIAAEYADFILVTVYTPNSGSELKRLDYRQQWDADFLAYLKGLEQRKPVLVCGDLNVAHKDIDLARPKPNYNKSAVYMQAEIDGIDNNRLSSTGFPCQNIETTIECGAQIFNDGKVFNDEISQHSPA